MIAFVVLGGLMVALAVGALVPFLLRQRRQLAASDSTRAVYRERLAELEAERERGNLSEAGFAEARDELEQEVLADADRLARDQSASNGASAPRIAILVGIVVPIAAVALYAATGRPTLIGSDSAQRLSSEAAKRFRQMKPAQRIGPLQDYVEANPKAPRAWRLLGQAYRSQKQYGDAYRAFEKARQASNTPDARLIARQAEALFLANGRNFSTSVERLIDKALEVEPRQPLALLLAGHAAMAKDKRSEAIDHWTTLKAVMPEGDRRRQQVKRLIARAKGQSGQGQAGANTSANASADGATSNQAGSSDGGRVTVRVTLGSGMAKRTSTDAPVFVFARPTSGSGPPLAVARTQVGKLPTEVVLSDAQAMMGDRTISQSDRVMITARVSSNGGVRAQPGDLQGQAGPVSVSPNARASLTIDRVVGQGKSNEDSTGEGQAQSTGASSASDATSPADTGRVTARVEVGDSVASSARPDMPVFVFAQRPGGQGPPLAVVKTRVSNLPTEITLSNDEAMVSGQKISQADRVVVTARASASGGVKPRPGDLQGKSEPVAVGPNARVRVTIDRRIE